MRYVLILLATSSLAACGGTGPTTVGATATPQGGTSNNPTTDVYAEFVKPTAARTYKGIGGSQVYEYSIYSRVNPTPGTPTSEQQKQVFAGNASTVRDTKMTLTYDPRDAIFTLSVTDPLSNAQTNTRFQDSGNRTQFGDPAIGPQWGAPNLGVGAYANSNVRYVQAGNGNPISPYSESGSGVITKGNNLTPNQGAPDASGFFIQADSQSTTFFYEVPGSTTKYVTFAGYVRNSMGFAFDQLAILNESKYHVEHGAFAYGMLTDNDSVPKTGSGSYAGTMLATAIYNPTLGSTALPTYYQWINGTANTTVNFATNVVDLSLAGIISDPFFDIGTVRQVTIPGGTSFAATGRATVDLVKTGGFTGAFSAASFGGGSTVLNIAGSSIDGAFYGPKANEVGGGFRIVGGIPNQRVDIMGAFTGK
jgi:hypothetical protein